MHKVLYELLDWIFGMILIVLAYTGAVAFQVSGYEIQWQIAPAFFAGMVYMAIPNPITKLWKTKIIDLKKKKDPI